MIRSGTMAPAKQRCNRQNNRKVLRIRRMVERDLPYTGSLLIRYGVQ